MNIATPPPSSRLVRALSLAAASLLASGATSAHDSWFEIRPGAGHAAGEMSLALGTGNQFPKLETGIGAEYLVAQGCAAAPGSDAKTPAASRVSAPLPLKSLRNDDHSLLMRAPAGVASCWAQLTPFEVVIKPEIVPVYLKDIQASPEIRATWAAMQQRGLPWRERYVKHARIDFGNGLVGGSGDLPAQPLGMDLRLQRDGSLLRAGGSVTAQVLRDGQPLPGQAIELRSDISPLGIWRKSDEQGRFTVPLPLAGHWILRGVDLRVSPRNADEWESRFVTLAFEVLPRARPLADATAHAEDSTAAPPSAR